MKSFALIIIGLVLFQSQISTCQEFVFDDYGINEGIHAIDEGSVDVDIDIDNAIDVLVQNEGPGAVISGDIEDPQTGEVIILNCKQNSLQNLNI